MNKEDFLKDYIQVNERITKFYQKFPDGSIQTKILSIDDEKVVIKAFAYRNNNDLLPSTGHAEEIRNATYINKTNAVENCETSAVGRALANLGFEIKQGIASKEEMEQAFKKQEFNKQNNHLASQEQKRKIFANAKSKGISNSEFKYLCRDITNKESSRNWTQKDLENINSYIDSLSITPH